MDVDRHAERLRAGEHRREVGVVEEPAVDGTVAHAADEAVLTHRAIELVGRRPGFTQRQGGERSEPVRPGRDDLVGDPVVEPAGEGHAFRGGQVLGAGCHRREHLDADPGLVHVRNPAGAEVEELGPAPAAGEEPLVGAGVQPLQLAGREVLLQSDEKQLPVVVRGAREGGADRPRRRRRGGAEARRAAEECAPVEGAARRPAPVVRMRVGHDVILPIFVAGPVMVAGSGRALLATGAGMARPYLAPNVMRRMTSWPSSQRCLKAAATWPAAAASIP